eukprot:2419238-Pleurochrysis_carterae.AAC.2
MTQDMYCDGCLMADNNKELVPQVLHFHQLGVGVVLCKRQRVDARSLGGPRRALCALFVELGLARLLLR